MILIASIILTIVLLVSFIFFRKGRGVVDNDPPDLLGQTAPTSFPLGQTNDMRRRQVRIFNGIVRDINNRPNPFLTDPCTWVDWAQNKNKGETLESFVGKKGVDIKCSFVLIRNNFKGEHLHFKRVAVYDKNDLDVAQTKNGGKARQSSTSYNAPATTAINGGTDYNHTESGYAQWWRVDLATPVVIHRVKIYNRVDCCQHRLDGAYFILYDENTKPFYIRKLTGDNLNMFWPKTDRTKVGFES